MSKVSGSSAARARALLSLYLKEATGGWREIRGYDYSIWREAELSQKKKIKIKVVAHKIMSKLAWHSDFPFSSYKNEANIFPWEKK